MNELQPLLWSAAEVLRDHLDPSQVRVLTLRLLALRALAPSWPEDLNASSIHKMQADVVEQRAYLKPAFTDLPMVDAARLRQLGETLAHADLRDTDQLSHAYEFLLGRFAKEEGRRAGQFYTPPTLVQLMVSLISPDHGLLYDPCCGGGGMFVHAAKYTPGLSFVGQECNPQTWALAALNLAVHGLRADLGPRAADTLLRDQHPDLRADFILANPPFNLSRWGAQRLSEDPRFRFGVPPDSNANLAWLQHITARLKPGGRAAVVMANGSLTNNRRGEDHIRHQLVQSGFVEAIITLPEQLFLNTPIAACVWVMGSRRTHDQRLLLLDARHQSHLVGRVRRAFDNNDIDSISSCIHRFREVGECDSKFATVLALSELSCGQPLTPGLYIDSPTEDVDDTVLQTIIHELRAQSERAQQLDEQLFECLEHLT
ncbi:MAG: type I restriction enzyme M protein [Kiritimatiellia bacterium]|jgi:type I restriction enzyme M protein